MISKKYDFNGTTNDIKDLLPSRKPFFRKMTFSNAEKRIAEILKDNPHPNIVSIYNVKYDHIDIELVNPYNDNKLISNDEKTAILEKMNNVKKHLQSFGIIYFDWKYDNIGIGEDGEIKLFDFDCSGIASLNQEEKIWEIKPFNGYAYRKCKEAEIINPFEMDDYSFNHFNLKF